MKTALLVIFKGLKPWTGIGLFACIFLMQRGHAQSAKRTNILFIISDDQGYPYASAYGCKFVQTPNFDHIASQGLLFNNYFVDAPQCSPSRAALLTGKHVWQLGPAGTHASIFAEGLVTYTDVLRENGYQVGYCGKGWGPGSWEDGGRTINPAGVRYFDKAGMYSKDNQEKRWTTAISRDNYSEDFKMFLAKRDEKKPFCFWLGGHEPHRSYQPGSGIKRGGDLSTVTVPGYLPDVKEVRSDFLDYALEIQWFDMQVGKALAALKAAGELDNTLIIFTGDNGMPFPRAKAFCLEAGVHTPMAIMWKNNIKNPGRVVNDLVAAVDLFPTILNAAGLNDTIAGPQGKNLVDIFEDRNSDTISRSRKYVYFGRERHSDARWHNLGYPQRAVRTQQYLYIWNLKPERYPAGAPKNFVADSLNWAYFDIDGSPTKSYMINHLGDTSDAIAAGKPVLQVKQSFSLFESSFGKFPEEMLYDIQKDPYCLNNLAGDMLYQKIKTSLASILRQKLKETADSRFGNTPDIWESYRRYGDMRNFPEPDWAKDKFKDSEISK